MNNQDPIYRKKVYQALKGELGDSFTKTEDEFSNLLDADKSYAKKVYTALKGELGDSFTKTENDFLSSIYSDTKPKKKETSASPSTSGGEVGTQGGKPKPPILSEELKQEYRIDENAKVKKPTYENYHYQGGNLIEGNETKEEQLHQQHKENNADYSELYNRYKNETSITEEDKQELIQGIDNDLQEKGIWNTLTQGAKRLWNKTQTHSKEQIVDENPLANERKQAIAELQKDGAKELDEELILAKTKEIALQKRKQSLIESKQRSFMEDLSDEEKQSLENYQNFEMKSFSRKDKQLMAEISLLKKNLDVKASELKDLSEKVKQYRKGEVPKDLAIQYQNKLKEVNTLGSEAKEKFLQYAENRKELGTALDNLDLFKRDYGFFTNIGKNIEASTTDIVSGLAGGVAYGLDTSDRLTGLSLNKPISEKALAISKFFKDDAEETRNSIMRPLSVDDINTMDDFGRWFFNTAIAQQVPILALTSTGVGGITALGVSGTGNKYTEMQEEGGYSDLQNIFVPIAFGGAEAFGSFVDATIMKGAGRILKSATDVERRMIAQGMFARAKEIGLDVGKSSLKEISEEAGTQVFQNMLDKYALGKDVVLADGVKDAIASSSVFALMPLFGHTGRFAKEYIKPFMHKDIQFDKTLKEISVLENELNSPENVLSDNIKSALERKLSKKKEILVNKFSDITKTVADMDDATYNEIIKVEKEKNAIREDAKAIQNDKGISDKVKELLLKDFKDDFKRVEDRQKELLNPTQKPNNVTNEIWQQKKDEATNLLVKEKQEQGEKDFTITDADISKKATELLNVDKTESTETKPTIKPNPIFEKARKKIADLFEFAVSNKSEYDWEDIANVSKENAEKITEATGLEITEDYKHVIESNAIRHSLDKHGNQEAESKRGQVAITKQDFELVPEIINNADVIKDGGKAKQTGQQTVIYEKTFNDGTTYIVEEIRTGRKKLAFKTMYKRKPTITDGLMPTSNSPSPITSETLPAPNKSASSDTNIQNKTLSEEAQKEIAQKQQQIKAYEQELTDPNLPTTLREQTEQKLATLEQEIESLQNPINEKKQENTVQETEQEVLPTEDKENTTSASSSDNETELNTSNRIDTAPPKSDVSDTNIRNSFDNEALVEKMTENAEAFEEKELTITNWVAEFGKDGKVKTPIGEVKMGDNQFTKLDGKDRGSQFSMIKPTLENPDIIIEDKSKAKEGNIAERDSSYVFIKAFKNIDGSKSYFFTSVTVKKGNNEVVVSNHKKRDKQVINLIEKGKVLYKATGLNDSNQPFPEHNPKTDNVGVSDTNIQNKKQNPRLQKVKKKRFKGLVERLKKAFTGNKVITDKSELKKYLEKTGQKIDNSKLQIIGEKGAKALDQAEERTHRIDNLATARKMETANKDAKAIRLATGWERGADGKWRYEVNNRKYSINKKKFNTLYGGEDYNTIKLSEVLTGAEELFKAYPQLKSIDVARNNLGKNTSAVYSSPGNGQITINISLTALPAHSPLLHEIQHAIQNIEGFERGGNPKSFKEKDTRKEKSEKLRKQARSVFEKQSTQWKQKVRALNQAKISKDFDKVDAIEEYFYEQANETDRKAFEQHDKLLFEANSILHSDKAEHTITAQEQYRRLGGETEARNVQSRMYFTDEQRRNTLLSKTEDVAREDQIFLRGENSGIAFSENTVNHKKLRENNRGTYPKIPTEKIFGNNVDNLPYSELKEYDEKINNQEGTRQNIDVSKIIPTQRNVNANNLEEVASVTEDVELIKKDDKYYVVDGHHRISNKILNKGKNINAIVYTRYLKDKDGEVYGAVFPDGTIYLDENKANFNTPIHEFAHVWIDTLKDANKELYDTGIRLVKKSKYYKDLKKSKYYKDLTDAQISEEALATAIGDKGEHFWSTHKKTYTPFMNWLNKFKGWLTDKFFINQKQGIENLTLDQFLDASLHDLLGGKEIKYNKTNFKIGDNSYKVINKNGTLTVENSRGAKVSKPTERKVLREYAEQYNFTLGERFTITDDITPSDDIDSEIAQNSNNPAELAEVILRTQTKDFINENSDADAIEIIEYVQGNVKRGVRNSKGADGSFVNQSDANNITNAIAKTYLKKDGKGLDVLAQELSEQTGKEITEQDIVDVILAYPNGVNDVQKEVRDKYSNPAKQRFTELTGLPSSDWYLNKAVRQDIAKENLNKEVEKDYLNHFAEEDLLSLEQEQNEFKDYEKANEQRDEVVFRTSDTSQNEQRPRVQEKSDSVSRAEESGERGKRINKQADRVLKRELNLKRLPQEAERGRIKGGRRNVEATLVVGTSDGTAKNLEAKQTELEKQQFQEEQLIAYAKREGIWFEENHDFGGFYDNGQEANVHLNKDGKTVTKVFNPYIFSLNPQEFLDRIAITNSLFPETALTLKGFTTENGEFRFVLEQPFIKKSNEILTPKEITNFLNSIGYKDNSSGTFTNDYYVLDDLHNGNIVKGIDGNIYAIDVVAWLNTEKEGYGGKQVYNELLPSDKSILKKGSESLQALDDALKQWEDKLDQFGKETLGMNMPVAVAQGMIKAMRLAVKTAKTTLDVLEAGRNYVRNTDWYKNLSETDKNNVEKTLTDDRNVFNNMDKIIDDAVEKARKEEKNKSDKRAERLKETTKKLRKQYVDIQQYNNEVVNEIRQRLKTDTLSYLTKTDVTSVLRQMNNAKTYKRVEALIDKVDFILSRGEYKKADADVKKLLKEPRKFLKSVNGQLKANRVDNETRKLFNRIFGYLSSDSNTLQNLLSQVDTKIANGDISDRTLNEKVAIESALQIQDATDLFEASKEVINKKNNAENAERLQLATELKQRAFNDLETLLNEGKYKLREQIKQEAKRLKQISEDFTEATNHKWNNTATNTEKANAQHKKKNSIFSKIFDTPKKVKDFFTKTVTNSFEYLLGYFDQQSNHGEGKPYQHFYSGENGIVQCDANYKNDKKQIKSEVKEGLKKILGVKLETLYNLHKHEQKITKEKATGIHLLIDGKRETQQQTMSISQALYVHLVSKMPDAKRKLEAQGWDDVAILQLQKYLGEDFLKVSDFMTDFLRNKYDKYNGTYNELLRTDLGFEDGYFPLKYIDADLTMEVDLAGSKFALPSVSNGHLKSKVKNKNRIDTKTDAFQVFNGYLESMERFHHYGRFTKDLNAVLSNKAIRNNMKTFDEQSLKDFQKLSKAVIGDTSDIKASNRERNFYRFNGAIAAGYIGYKGYTALKQFLSIPAYTEKANDVHIGFNGNQIRVPFAGKLAFGSKMVINLNPFSVWKSYRFLKKNSAHFVDRLDKGSVGDEFIDNLFSQNSSSLYSKAFKYIAKKGITPNKFIDAITISTGGKVYYDQQFKNYKKAGLKESEAHAKAIRDFEISFKLTQQSSDASDLSLVQHSKGVMTSLFVPFKNAQFSYLRRISANSNNILRRYKKEKHRLQELGVSGARAGVKALKKVSLEGQTYRDLENVLLYTHALPLLWQYVGSGLPGLLTDWEDDDTEEMVRAGALGVFEGVFILGDATKWIYNSTVLGKNWNYETSILLSEMQTILNDIKKAYKNAGEFNEDVLLEAGKGYLKTKSVNTDTFINIYNGANQMIEEGEFSQQALMKILNAPKELRKGNSEDNSTNSIKNTGYKNIRYKQ